MPIHRLEWENVKWSTFGNFLRSRYRSLDFERLLGGFSSPEKPKERTNLTLMVRFKLGRFPQPNQISALRSLKRTAFDKSEQR
jgi:hypothetical protein